MHKALRRIALAATATMLAVSVVSAEAGQPGADVERAAGMAPATAAPVTASPITATPVTSTTLKASTASTASMTSPAHRTRVQGTLKGQVVRHTDRSPIARASVTFYDAGDRQNRFVAFTYTDADGRYCIYAPPGNYVAQFYGEHSDLAVEYNGNRHTIDKAPVIVVRAKTVTVVSAALGPGGQIDGRAIDEVTGRPLRPAPRPRWPTPTPTPTLPQTLTRP